jgi:hypothetical protein
LEKLLSVTSVIPRHDPLSVAQKRAAALEERKRVQSQLEERQLLIEEQAAARKALGITADGITSKVFIVVCFEI